MKIPPNPPFTKGGWGDLKDGEDPQKTMYQKKLDIGKY
jgi:hypothetical protein